MVPWRVLKAPTLSCREDCCRAMSNLQALGEGAPSWVDSQPRE